MKFGGKTPGRAAAALCAAAIAFSALKIKPADPVRPDGIVPFSKEPQSVSALISSDTEYVRALEKSGYGKHGEEDTQQNGSSKSDTKGEEQQNTSPLSQLSEESRALNGDEEYYPNGKNIEPANTDTDSGADGQKLSDDGDHSDTPGEKPAKGNETDEEYFTTDIPDGETVGSPELSFTITHLREELTVKRIDVSVNGRAFPWSGAVTLSNGENTVRVAVTYTDEEGKVISAFRDYTVYLNEINDEPQKPQLVTDLSNGTTSVPELEFFAYVNGGAENVRLTVYKGGEKLSPNGSSYRCSLDMGINSIRIRARYDWNAESFDESLEFEIKLIADTTPETAPYLEYHNVPETVRGSLYTLDLAPRDYKGQRLYYNNLYVRLNENTIKYSWDGDFISYLLKLSAGENALDIRVTDSDGRYTDYSFVITCLYAEDGEAIGTAVLEADADVLGLGRIMPETQIEIRQGESAAETISRALEQNGFTVSATGGYSEGFYLARLYKSGIAAAAGIPARLLDLIGSDSDVQIRDQQDPDSLGEKDYTNASGWMISVNGYFTGYGASDLHLKDGDRIRIRYTLAYGKDIGGAIGGENYEITY